MAFTEKYVSTTGAGAHTGADEANALTWAEMLTFGGATSLAGIRFNIKSDAGYSRTTSADAFTVTAGAPTIAAPMMLRGYSSTIGDLESNGRTGSTGALVLTGFPVVTYTTGNLTLPVYTIVQQCDIASAIAGNAVVAGTNSMFRRSRVRNTHATSAASVAIFSSSNYTTLVDCDISIASNHASAVALDLERGQAHSCRISGADNGGGMGVNAATFSNIVACQIFDIQKGVDTAGLLCIVEGCSFRNIAGSNVRVNGGSAVALINNAAWGTNGASSRWLEVVTAAKSIIQVKNAVGNFGAADTNEGDWPVIDEVALSADPFTSSSDLIPNSTSGGGASLKGVGLLAYNDIGAIQVQAAAAGGARVIGG